MNYFVILLQLTEYAFNNNNNNNNTHNNNHNNHSNNKNNNNNNIFFCCSPVLLNLLMTLTLFLYINTKILLIIIQITCYWMLENQFNLKYVHYRMRGV